MALTSPTGRGGRSVEIVRLRTQAIELICLVLVVVVVVVRVYPQKLALTSLTSVNLSVGTVRSQTQATEL
jgi:hypothetical protein